MRCKNYNLLHVNFYILDIFYDGKGNKKYCGKSQDENSLGTAEQIQSRTLDFYKELNHVWVDNKNNTKRYLYC